MARPVRLLWLVALAAGCDFSSSSVPPRDARTADASQAGAIDAGPGGGPDAPVGSMGDAGAPPDAPAGGGPDAAAAGPDSGVTTGAYHHYVTSSLRVGRTPFESASLAFDLDGDGLKDNALGGYLSSMALASGPDIDDLIAEALTSGDQVILHSLRADGLTTDPTAEWIVIEGAPKADPDLTSGYGVFTVAASATSDRRVEGPIEARRFDGGPGRLFLEIPTAGGGLLPLDLVGARVDLEVGERGCSGRLGGGITSAALDATILPAIAAALDAEIEADEGCREDYNACSASTKLLLGLFDLNGDRVITALEVKESPVGATVFRLDVDLLDEHGDPGQDGVPDSLSIALGLTCVRAVFDVPWEP